jgi:hypothetical protein
MCTRRIAHPSVVRSDPQSAKGINSAVGCSTAAAAAQSLPQPLLLQTTTENQRRGSRRVECVQNQRSGGSGAAAFLLS